MPRRRDIDPAEIPALLPHIAIVDRYEDSYRWRLMGGALVTDFGRDLTGQKFGEFVAASPLVDAMKNTFDQVLGTGKPMFEESAYETSFGNIQSVSRLLLPLNTEHPQPGMVIFTRITRFEMLSRAAEQQNRLRNAFGVVLATFEISSIQSLEQRATDWERKAVKMAGSGLPVR